MRLPGLKQQRELRFWSISDLASYAGLTWPTAAQADAGKEVSPRTAKAILEALEGHPPSETARQLHQLASHAGEEAVGG